LKVQHNWKTIRSSDVLEMSNAVAALYAGGLGILGEDPEIGYDMMGWDKTKLRERQQPSSPQDPSKPEQGLPGEETVDAKA